MRKIFLDGKEVKSLAPESLPMLIHGKEGSGASLYTICLAAKWFSQRYEVLFLCGYPAAEREFNNEAGNKHKKAKFFTKDKISKFISALQKTSDETIVFMKNAELFDYDLFRLISSRQNIIISGDINKVTFKKKILEKKFTSEIFFSSLEGREMPKIKKYHGYITSGTYMGFTSLK